MAPLPLHYYLASPVTPKASKIIRLGKCSPKVLSFETPVKDLHPFIAQAIVNEMEDEGPVFVTLSMCQRMIETQEDEKKFRIRLKRVRDTIQKNMDNARVVTSDQTRIHEFMVVPAECGLLLEAALQTRYQQTKKRYTSNVPKPSRLTSL